jgi:hypothetical protein
LEQLNRERGGVTVVYFSGHGTRWPEEDDEGLLPSDVAYRLTNAPDNKWIGTAAAITGEDLRQHLEKMADADTSVVLIFDCCHSGRVYRSSSLAGRPKVPPSRFIFKYGDVGGGWRPRKASRFVHLAAAAHTERAVEVTDAEHTAVAGGAFSLALAAVLTARDRAERLTYGGLIRLILQHMEKRGRGHQSPQLEGNANLLLFDAEEAPPEELAAPEIAEVTPTAVTLRSGSLHLVLPGLYDVHSTARRSTGLVSLDHVGNTQSRGRIIENRGIQVCLCLPRRASTRPHLYVKKATDRHVCPRCMTRSCFCRVARRCSPA